MTRIAFLAVAATVALTACGGSSTGPTTIATIALAAGTAPTSSAQLGSDDDAGTISVRIVSQERIGPCIIHVSRVPTADPIPIPHDGEDYVDLEWCAESSAGHVNATAELSSTDHPEIDVYDGLGDFIAGCHTTRTYWARLFPRYDQVHVSVTAGLLHDRANCGIRY